MHSIEVEIDAVGVVHPVDPVTALPEGRARLTWETGVDHDCYLLSETALADGWAGPEEDAAWAHLQPVK